MDGESHSWCETELAYKEYKDMTAKKATSDYRLGLHKNGTRVIATYDLEEGVKATFKFAYDAGDDEVRSMDERFLSHSQHKLTFLPQITDTIVWKGPLASGQYQQEDVSPANKKPELYKFPKCGAATIKFRTDLTIEGKKGKKGVVDSEHRTDDAGKEQYYGVQQGFSYDWEKCGY